jgi:hypothetical protein
MVNQWVIYMVSEGDYIEERTEDLTKSLLLADINRYTIIEIIDTSYNPSLAPF